MRITRSRFSTALSTSLRTEVVTPVAKRPENASPLFTRLWVGWIVAFCVIEGLALVRKRPQDTLSDHVWAWFDIPKHTGPTGNVRVRRVALLSFMAWLSSHFLTGDDV